MKTIRLFYRICTAGLLCSLIIGGTGCTQAPPGDCADELVRNEWLILDSTEKEKGKLYFNNNNVIFDADVSGKRFHMNEQCIVDTKKLTVTSENFGTFTVDYKIDGNQLLLTYFGKEISLRKK